MLEILFSIRYRKGMLGIPLFVAFHMLSASGGSYGASASKDTCVTNKPVLEGEYVSYNDGPGCGEKSVKSSQECGLAAASLGFNGNVGVGTWGSAPPGCMVGYKRDGYKKTWFNKYKSGATGKSKYRSVCHKDDQWPKMKEEYMKCIKTPQCDNCVNTIQDYLPLLLQADKIEENEVGETFVEQACVGAEKKYKNCRRTDYKAYVKNTLSLTEGVTLSKKNEIITIDGTVKGVVGGKRNYDAYYPKLRPVELYAPKGKIVTIEVPKEMIGKLGVIVGLLKYGHQFKLEFPPTKKSVLKVASPWGGPIILQIAEKNAIKGFFNITVNNALRTPIFTFGKNTNDQWNNELKNYSPNWAILRIPRQVDMLVNSDRIKYVTDMEAAMSRVKHTMDLLEDMMGLPPNSKPGADIWLFSFGGGGVRHGVCRPGMSANGGYYIKELLETGGEGVTLHEAGHGWCYRGLPSNGGQWTAEHVSSYIHYKLGIIDNPIEKDVMDSPELDFDLMYRMVSFDLYSNGKACGRARFNSKQLKTSAYDLCWKWLSWIPEKAHGWDVYKDVNTLVANSKTNYRSSSDRMIDLYCQATKHNMLPLFSDLYNLQPAGNVKENCEKLPKSELIGNWLDIVQCVKESMTTGEKDIRKCAKLPHFPKHEGLCVLSGECQNDEANGGKTTTMKNKFDLYGSTGPWLSKKFSADKEKNCLKRAMDYFKDCKNKDDQKVTATFYKKNTEDEVSYTHPPLVAWKQISDTDCWSSCKKKGGPCPSFCGPDAYCCRDGYDDGCPMAAYGASPSHHTCVTGKPISEATWRQKDGADCWSKCGRKGGPCPNFCGSNGFCCRKGYGGCPLRAAEKSPKHHTCVLKQETDEK